MNCRRVRRLLPLMVGGDLAERPADRVMSHLDSCGSCSLEQTRYEESRKVLFRLKQTSRGPVPDLWPEVRRRIEVLPVPARRFPLRAVAAALLVAATGTTLALTLLPDSPETPKPGPAVAIIPEELPADEPSEEAFLHEVVPAGMDEEPMFASVDIPERSRYTWDEF